MTMLPPEVQEQVTAFVNKLAASTALNSYENDPNVHLNSSLSVALATVAIFKRIVSQAEWNTASDIMKIIRAEGRIMSSRAGINEMIVGNIVRRILKIIREDYHSASTRPFTSDATDGVSSTMVHCRTSETDMCGCKRCTPLVHRV